MNQVNPKIALVCTGSGCLAPDHPEQIFHTLKNQYQLNVIMDQSMALGLPVSERSKLFLEYCLDDSIDIIWAIRGGEGNADCLPVLHRKVSALRDAKPKRLLGFSDFTVMLHYFSKHFNWPCAHGPNAASLALNHIDQTSINKTIDWIKKNDRVQTILSTLQPLNNETWSEPVTTLSGGNLSLLNISIGDIWEPDFKNTFVFIEDINEKPHSIARTLKYLQRIGKFNAIKGLVIGDFELPPEYASQHAWLEQFFLNFSEQYRLPLFKTLAIGHGKSNWPVPLN